MYLHLLVAIIRVIDNYQTYESPLAIIILVIANSLIYISLYYFTFELVSISAALKSNSPLEFNKKQSRIICVKWTLIGLTVVYCIIESILYGYVYSKSPVYNENKDIFNVLFLVSRSIKFACDIFVSIVFMLQINFLFKYRKENSQRNFTALNITIMVLVFLVFLATVAQVTSIFIVIFF